MSEEKKKLGVEDLVKSQQETAEQLKIIAERLDWICDTETQPYNVGCLWVWLVPSLFVFLAAGGAASNQRSEGLLGLIALCLIVLVALNLKHSTKTPRRQRADRWADEQYQKKEEEAFEQRQKMLQDRAAKKAQEKKNRIIASKPMIDLNKDS